MSVSDNQYLAHFGIFGMKWGVRRYQNEDGSLTEEGKKRYRLLDQMKDRYKQGEKDYLDDARIAKENLEELKKRGPEDPKKWLNDSFGKDWQDAEYMKIVWEIDDPLSFAKSETKKEHDYQLKASIKAEKDARQRAKQCADLFKQWSNVSINDLTDSQMKELKEYDKFRSRNG